MNIYSLFDWRSEPPESVVEALERLEREGFADSQGPTARKMLWRRRWRNYQAMRDREGARRENRKFFEKTRKRGD